MGVSAILIMGNSYPNTIFMYTHIILWATIICCVGSSHDVLSELYCWYLLWTTEDSYNQFNLSFLLLDFVGTGACYVRKISILWHFVFTFRSNQEILSWFWLIIGLVTCYVLNALLIAIIDHECTLAPIPQPDFYTLTHNQGIFVMILILNLFHYLLLLLAWQDIRPALFNLD